MSRSMPRQEPPPTAATEMPPEPVVTTPTPSASTPRRRPPAPPRSAPDEVELAKQRLLALGEQTTPATVALLHRHPYAAAAAALAAGLLVGRVPAMRKLAGVAAAWGLKRAVTRYVGKITPP